MDSAAITTAAGGRVVVVVVGVGMVDEAALGRWRRPGA